MSEVSRARAASGAGLTGRTRSERILWNLLRTREPGWLAEMPTGQYRLDFFCPDLRLAVEVDGASHWGERARKYDEKRDQWHLQHGIRTTRVSAREVETDPVFVMRHIDDAVARRRLEYAIMPPSTPPIWDLLAAQALPAAAPAARRGRPRTPAFRVPVQRRRRPQGRARRGRQEPSWLALGAVVLALLAFFNNWFGAQDAYWDLTRRGTDQVAKSLTDALGAGLLVPRPVIGATVCPASKPACGRALSAGNAQLLAERMNLAVPAQPPPADLVCQDKPSAVVTVTFSRAAGSTVVEVLPGCGVIRSGGVVRRATPGVLGQVAALAAG
jgi:very-short-patch-repair endonuclease